jgi:hypothetical protein
MEFASKIYNSKSREIFELGQNGNLSILNYMQPCQIWKFLEMRKNVFCIFQSQSFGSYLKNTLEIGKDSDGPILLA